MHHQSPLQKLLAHLPGKPFLRRTGACALLALTALPVRAQTFVPVPTTHKFPYVGGDISSQERLELVPGRQFLDYQGNPTDAVRFLADNGFNAVRLHVGYSSPYVYNSPPPDNTNVDARELNFELDYGGIDRTVALAQRAKANGQKLVLTVQFGESSSVRGNHEFIPPEWLNYTYTQTLTAIDQNTRTMLDYFLKAGVQPDVVLMDNESDAGILYEYVDANGNEAQRYATATNVFDNTATGSETIWPKCTGYWKQEILSAKDEIAKYVGAANAAKTRFGVHTTDNNDRAHYKFDEIFENAHANAEQDYYLNGVDQGTVTVIPDNIRNTNLRDILDILGFSYYPGTPTAQTQAAFDAALDNDNSTMYFLRDMAYFNTKIPAYGRYTDGPFQGQYKKQALVVEYGTNGGSNSVFTIPCQQAYATYFFNVMAQYEWALGALWWEPVYAENNNGGGKSSLYRAGAFDNTLQDRPLFTPIATLQTWGSFGLPDPASQYTITSRSSGKFLEIFQHSTGAGAWTDMGSNSVSPDPWKLWTFQPNPDGSLSALNVNSGLGLVDWGSSTTAGAHQEQQALTNPVSTYQEWNLRPTGDGYQFLLNAFSGQALDIASSGGWGIQNPLNTSSLTQQWDVALVPKLYLTNHSNNSVLGIFQNSIYGGAWAQPQTEDTNNHSVFQQWRVLSNGDGFYRIVNATTDYVLQTNPNGTDNHIYQSGLVTPYTTIQEWQEVALGGGYFQLVNRSSGEALDLVSGFGQQSAVNTSSTTQQWSLVLAP